MVARQRRTDAARTEFEPRRLDLRQPDGEWNLHFPAERPDFRHEHFNESDVHHDGLCRTNQHPDEFPAHCLQWATLFDDYERRTHRDHMGADRYVASGHYLQPKYGCFRRNDHPHGNLSDPITSEFPELSQRNPSVNPVCGLWTAGLAPAQSC